MSPSRTALVTGANRGIGAEMVRQLRARGDAVVGTARTADGTDAIAALGAEALLCDVADPASLAAAAEAFGDRGLDLLVCNAGVYVGRGGIEDPALDAEAWRAQLMTNVAGPFMTVRAFLPALERAGGKVAVISSQMGCSGRVNGASYGYRASKAGATNVAFNLAVELAPRGIAVGAWHPGWVRTEMGGEAADVAVEESAAGLIARFDALALSGTGRLEDWRGEPMTP